MATTSNTEYYGLVNPIENDMSDSVEEVHPYLVQLKHAQDMAPLTNTVYAVVKNENGKYRSFHADILVKQPNKDRELLAFVYTDGRIIERSMFGGSK